MKRFAWMIIAAGLMAVGLGSGCLVTNGNSSHADCCYEYQRCETYCDPFGNCSKDCWYENSCPDSCATSTGGSEPSYCYSDVDCPDGQVCVNNTCHQADTTQRGNAGLCQACETNADCADPNALCVRLGEQGTVGETVCTTPCGSGCPNGFECVSIDGSAQCLPAVNDQNVRTCASAPSLECVTARDCQVGESCVNNHCQAPTTEECAADNDCSPGEACQNGTCVADNQPECTTRSDCASGEVCVSGQCQQGTQSCVFNSECSGDGLCVDGTCYASCSADSDCGNYEHCRQGVCRRTECRGTSDCAGDEICVDAACKPACDPSASTDTCAAGYVCTQNGFCDRDPNVECRSNAECSRDEICDGGTCKVPCECNQDCPTGQVCDLDNGTCKDPGANAPTTCETTCDCPSGQQCSNGACVNG